MAFSGVSRDTGNGGGIKEKDRAVKVVQKRGQSRFNILESFYADGAEGKLDLSLLYGCGEGFQSPRTLRSAARRCNQSPPPVGSAQVVTSMSISSAANKFVVMPFSMLQTGPTQSCV